jgi:hypothetical protein
MSGNTHHGPGVREIEYGLVQLCIVRLLLCLLSLCGERNDKHRHYNP